MAELQKSISAILPVCHYLPVLLLLGAIAVAASTTGASLIVAADVEIDILDYELPDHPRAEGRGHLGFLLTPSLIYRPSPLFELEAGVRVRLPLALDFEEELGAIPVAAVRIVANHDPLVRLTFGSLSRDHGFHPAVYDEDRQRYLRDIEDAYNSTLLPLARRQLGTFMPGEHGASLFLDGGLLRAEALIDWQLLETEEHREKFAFGTLLWLDLKRVVLGGQLRVVHYGGQRFTEVDVIRFRGLDSKRQPITLAATLRGLLIEADIFDISLLGAIIAGNMIQTPGGRARWFSGVELGGEASIYEAVLLGYRLWRPRGSDPGALSEDGDPIYSGEPSHRFTIGLSQQLDALSVEGRLDLIRPFGSSSIQYEAVTIVRYRFETTLWQEESAP